jgi:hypothetical protein
LFDAIEIRLGEGTRRERAGRHAIACLDRAELDDVESWRDDWLCAAGNGCGDWPEHAVRTLTRMPG